MLIGKSHFLETLTWLMNNSEWSNVPKLEILGNVLMIMAHVLTILIIGQTSVFRDFIDDFMVQVLQFCTQLQA